MLAAEAAPLVKVGGLGDVVGALPAELRALGHDVRIALPHYGLISALTQCQSKLSINWGRAQVTSTCTPVAIEETSYLLIGGEPIAQDESVYGHNAVVDTAKFVFFALAALKHACAMGFNPDVVHVHDAHPGAALRWLQQAANAEPLWRETARVLTIHNIGYQYNEAGEALAQGGLRPTTDNRVPSWARSGLLALAIRAADRINSVSPTYAKEILTSEYGSGLHGLLSARARRLSGILNGVDYQRWNPAQDNALAQNYTVEMLPAREENRRSLQQEFGLPVGPAPLLGVVSRLDHQKGLDLLAKALPTVLRESEAGLVVLGSGDARIQSALQQLVAEFPERVALQFRFDEGLARRIYGGADMLLLPSRYEPCGLVQMIAMHYGAVPLVRATGGLRDTVTDCDADPAGGTGFVFDAFTPRALRAVLKRALTRFKDRLFWEGVQRRGMALDFSWAVAGLRYQALYQQAIDDRSRRGVD